MQGRVAFLVTLESFPHALAACSAAGVWTPSGYTPSSYRSRCHKASFNTLFVCLLVFYNACDKHFLFGACVDTFQVEASEMEVVRDQMQREGIELISGTARFLRSNDGEPHRVMVLRTSEEAEAKTR